MYCKDIFKYLFLTILFASAFCFSPVIGQDLDNNHQDKLKEASKLIRGLEYEQAEDLLIRLQDYYTENDMWPNLVEALNYRVSIKRHARDFEAADRLLEKADSIAGRFLDIDALLYSSLYNNKAYLAEARADLEQAGTWAENSLEIAKSHQDSDLEIVRAYIANGYVFDSMGDYPSAIQMYENGLEIAEPKSEEEVFLNTIVLIYNNLGVSYRRSGQPEVAMDFYKRNQPYIAELFDENHPEVAMNYNNVGAIYYQIGDVGRAAEYFLRAGSILQDYHGLYHSMVAAAYNNAGLCYYRLNDFENATRYLEKAQRIKEEVLGENHLDTAIGYANLASIYLGEENYDQALQNYNRSLEVRIANYGNDHPNLVPLYMQKGKLHLEMDEPHKALSNLGEAGNIAIDKLGLKHPDVAEIFKLIGDAHREINQFIGALDGYQKALTLIVENFEDESIHSVPEDLVTSHPMLLLNVLSAKADLLQTYYLINRDKLYAESAYKTYLKSIDLVEDLQHQYQHESSKLNLLGNNYSIFEGSVLAAHNLYNLTGDEYYLDSAFSIMEKGKARVAHELMEVSQSRNFSGVPEEVIRRENEFNDQINTLLNEINLEKDKGLERDDERIRGLQDSLFDVQQDLREYIEVLEEEYPAYHVVKYDRNVVDLAAVREKILEPGENLLSYLVGDEHTFVMVVSPENAKLIKLDHNPDLPKFLGELRDDIYRRENRYAETAHQLYMQLIAPVLEFIDGNRLRIIPDHALYYLPFELLLADLPEGSDYSSWPYLIREFEISYAPSATILDNLNQAPGIELDNLLTVAPHVTSETFAPGENVLRDYTASLAPLPISRYETEEIAKIFESRRSIWNPFGSTRSVTTLFNREASAQSIKEIVSRYNVVHFATHAFIHENNPSLSGILVASDENEDGIIYLNDIYNLNLNAELVVLSACETGLGQLARGEGMIGFSRAFLFSGASSLVVSMWKVNERPTSELMIRFYTNLVNGESKSEALRNAKLFLMDRPEMAHPKNWAAFVLTGRN